MKTCIRSFAPQRNDWWDKQWIRADPTHRLALLEYRRFGLVYPFGAANYHFNTPNRFLFEPNGRWIQSDHANPLESWEYALDHVIQCSWLTTVKLQHRSSPRSRQAPWSPTRRSVWLPLLLLARAATRFCRAPLPFQGLLPRVLHGCPQACARLSRRVPCRYRSTVSGLRPDRGFQHIRY
jgi:hypothetical protein